MTIAPIRIQLVPSGDIIDFPDDEEGVRFRQIEAGLIALGLERTRSVGTVVEELSLFRRGALQVALYWDGYFTALRPSAENGGDFTGLFAEMTSSPVFEADQAVARFGKPTGPD
ncbi:MAG: hypothetical protein REJ23_12735 [Brevundimonas sp.]|nr:hypothetical protein [Brevundimonas sp.]